MRDERGRAGPGGRARTGGHAGPGGRAWNVRGALLVITCVVAACLAAPCVRAQVLVDTTYSWRAYAEVATCGLVIYAGTDEERPRVVVLRELAENGGPSTTDDARYLVERIGRDHGIRPDEAYWIFHWGPFSFRDGAGGKELFLRATFRAGAGGSAGSPSWRVVTRADVEALTDRLFR